MKKRRETIKSSSLTIALIGLLFGAVVLYLYFLNMSVVHVVMRQEHVQSQNQLNTEIAELEARFIEAQHSISIKIAEADNYQEELDKVFVSREQASLVLGGF
jgi:hypothetical protein